MYCKYSIVVLKSLLIVPCFAVCNLTTQATCTSGECIHQSSVCDCIRDCEDGSDENNCTTAEHLFRCANGDCISRARTCDCWNDCEDGSDEMNCSYARQCQHCSDAKGRQIPFSSSQRCDCTQHCFDGYDEQRCDFDEFNKRFICDDGSCVHTSARCNQTHECADGSDERGCGGE